MKLYGIKDTMAGTFSVPFAAENNNVAKRAFAEEANNPNSRVCVFSKDMDLYSLGEWDTKTGEIKPEVEWLANANEFKEV